MLPNKAASLTLNFTNFHYTKRNDQLRMGQRFYNMFYKEGDSPNPSLFYEVSNSDAALDIFLLILEKDDSFVDEMLIALSQGERHERI